MIQTAMIPMNPHDIRHADRKRLAALFDFAVEPEGESPNLREDETSSKQESESDPASRNAPPRRSPQEGDQ